MKKPRAAFSDAAIADILEQSDWYEAQADRSLAQRWEEAVTATLLRIAQRPRIGSRCSFTADECRPVGNTAFCLDRATLRNRVYSSYRKATMGSTQAALGEPFFSSHTLEDQFERLSTG